MQFAEDGVAVGVLGDLDQHPAEVAAAGQRAAALEPDPVHGDHVPGPHLDLGADAGLAEHPADVLGDGAQRIGQGGVLQDQFGGAEVVLGVEDGEDQVLQFGLQRLDAEAFGERDQHVPGDLGDAGLLLGPHDAEGAHVVQPVGELDRHDADIVAGGDEHLAEGLRLGGGAVVDLLQFGDAVDEEADLLAELLPYLIERHLGVLDGVVEQ